MAAADLDEIDVVNADQRVDAVGDRAAILAAVQATADANGGLVHAATLRAHLHREVEPHRIGAVICGLVRSGALAGTGHYLHNGGAGSRNSTKASEVRRLVRPLDTTEETR